MAANVDPAKLEAMRIRTKQILESGQTPDEVFACGNDSGLFVYLPGANEKPVMLLFTNPFMADDYLRATGKAGLIRELKAETLPELARTWLSAGLQGVAFDRCPRCPQFTCTTLAQMTTWTKSDFAKTWAVHRAGRLVLGEIRLRSAIRHLSQNSHAEARTDLEYIRDHFDCSIPYLHQMIGLISGTLQDEKGKAAARDRLKEFGPPFDGMLDFSPETLVTAMVGLGLSFGLRMVPPG